MNAIKNFIDRGIEIIPISAKTRAPAIPKKSHVRDYLTNDKEKLKAYWQQGRKAFAFIPADTGRLVLDIDRKKGIDGLLNFRRFMIENNIVLPYDIEDHPCRTLTPSGGLHLYFSFKTDTDIINSDLVQGVEVKHTMLVTVPGSQSQAGRYILQGSLDDIPILPYSLRKHLVPRQAESKPYKDYFNDKKYKDRDLTPDKIKDILIKQGNYPNEGNRNKFCFEFSKFAIKKGYQKTEIESYLVSLVDLPVREVSNCINSVYKKRGM